MKELDALVTWSLLTMPQRSALLAGIPFGYRGDAGKTWAELPRETQEKLLALDWNFMIGGRLGKRSTDSR
jgi:hypothetical protein